MANEYDKILRDNFKEPKAALLRQLVAGMQPPPILPQRGREMEKTVAETGRGIRAMIKMLRFSSPPLRDLGG